MTDNHCIYYSQLIVVRLTKLKLKLLPNLTSAPFLSLITNWHKQLFFSVDFDKTKIKRESVIYIKIDFITNMLL